MPFTPSQQPVAPRGDVPEVRFGPFELDPVRHELRRHGRLVKLDPTPLRLLTYLVEHRDRPVPREELLEAVWSGVTVSDAAVWTALRQVRVALGDDAETQRWVRTVRGRGYQFVGPLDEGAGEARNARRSRWVALGAGIAAMTLAGALLLVNRGTGPLPVESIAVLPLTDVSLEASSPAFAAGVTELLILRLAQVDTLRVTSWSSVRGYAGQSRPPREIASELGVEAILEGTVALDGRRVRVTAQLIDPRADAHLWAKSYEAVARDLLSLQNEIATDVAASIGRGVPGPSSPLAIAREAVDPEAQKVFFEGRYLLYSSFTPDALRRATTLFERAAALAPSFPMAHVALSDAYYFHSGNTGPPHDWMPRARSAAERALELDLDFSEAHDRLAWVSYAYDWDLSGARRLFEKAIRLSPSNPSARLGYALVLSALGQHEAAIEQAEARLALAPLDLLGRNAAAGVFLDAGDEARALDELEAVQASNPQFSPIYPLLMELLLRAGREEDALVVRETFYTLMGVDRELAEGALRFIREEGLQGAYRVELASLLSRSQSGYADPFRFAVAYTNLGRPDDAFEWLERAYEQRSGGVVAIESAAWAEPLRDDPRYEALVRKIRGSDSRG